MYKTIGEAYAWMDAFLTGYQDIPGVEVVIFPPFTALHSLYARFQGAGPELGAQNLHAQREGAYTGEIGAGMIRDTGAGWVLVGHSERRLYQQENEPLLATKIRAALQAGLRPVYCVGELLEERENGTHEATVSRQLREGIPPLDPSEWDRLVIAYEPVWAIGTGRTATVGDAGAMHRFIRQEITSLSSASDPNGIPILYGGSVKPNNAGELFDCPDIDGVLVGGASLDPGSFQAILAEAQRRR